MTNVVWAKPDGTMNLLTTQLDGLASGATSETGSVVINTGGRVYADVEFVSGGTFSPGAGAYIELWLLRSIDGGAHYEDGSPSNPPSKPADIAIMIRAGSSISPRCGAPGLMLPPGYYKPIARNMTGAALPSSGNYIRMAAYSEAV